MGKGIAGWCGVVCSGAAGRSWVGSITADNMFACVNAVGTWSWVVHNLAIIARGSLMEM